MAKIINNNRTMYTLKVNHVRYLKKLLNDNEYRQTNECDMDTIQNILDSGEYNDSERKIFNELVIPNYENYKRYRDLFNDDLPF